MQNKLLFIFLFCLSTAYSNVSDKNGWNVTKDTSLLSYTAEFEINKGGTSLGKVVRSGLFTPRYYYDLYDVNDSLQVRGITRAFSLGFLFAWGTEIDLYDADRLVGMIQGEVWTSSRAKFAFYDANSVLTAHAYLDDESCDFLIVSAQNKGKVLAKLKGTAYGDASTWELKPLTNPIPMDERALQIFAGFVADFQKDFIRPPKVVTQFYYIDKGN